MMSETCLTYESPSEPCRRQAVEAPLAGCVHEHLAPRPVCQYHIEDLIEGRLFCGACHDCADPHDCPLVVVAAVRGGAA